MKIVLPHEPDWRPPPYSYSLATWINPLWFEHSFPLTCFNEGHHVCQQRVTWWHPMWNRHWCEQHVSKEQRNMLKKIWFATKIFMLADSALNPAFTKAVERSEKLLNFIMGPVDELFI